MNNAKVTKDGGTIDMMDYAGVAMAGVQALIVENAALKARVERLEGAIN